jgi:DNA-directed RNA polymerase specialized sigma24 family protein
MGTMLTAKDLDLLLREAKVTATRLVSRLSLPTHEIDDIIQDLLTDLLARLKGFNPARGSFGAFVGRVMANRASRLTIRIWHQRAIFAPSSLDDPLSGYDGATLIDTITQEGGSLLWPAPKDPFAQLHRRLALHRALNTLRREHIQLLEQLSRHSIETLSEARAQSRATLALRTDGCSTRSGIFQCAASLCRRWKKSFAPVT